uniref:NADH-ubiquinone oxidoreductase chain 4 n=1 Tax=Acanthogobius hasta TaxID=267130 RepID=A0A0U1X635_9GOBI|nr:NADH dehydrogenase subunit 4 [Acanthogobius hasta]
MLKVLIPTIMLVPTVWLTPAKLLWPATLAHSLTIAVTSFSWLSNPCDTGWSLMNQSMALDPLSTPLLVLTCWLLPLMILASQHHMIHEPINRQRTFITILTTLQVFLILAFSATELIFFYIMFEATLVPTLILITRWGNQAERLNAGTYFLFYTLAGSLPLLIALLLLQNTTGTLSLFILHYTTTLPMISIADKLWWAGCLVAFLVKMPLYGMHLWLPKAHVEAPIAGSMILAAIFWNWGVTEWYELWPFLSPWPRNWATRLLSLPYGGLSWQGLSACGKQTWNPSSLTHQLVTWDKLQAVSWSKPPEALAVLESLWLHMAEPPPPSFVKLMLITNEHTPGPKFLHEAFKKHYLSWQHDGLLQAKQTLPSPLFRTSWGSEWLLPLCLTDLEPQSPLLGLALELLPATPSMYSEWHNEGPYPITLSPKTPPTPANTFFKPYTFSPCSYWKANRSWSEDEL